MKNNIKLPLVSRKKYDAIQNKNLKLTRDKVDLESELYLLELGYKSLEKEVRTLREDLKEIDSLHSNLYELKEENENLVEKSKALRCKLKRKNKELHLSKQYSDTAANKICELNTKLVAAETKNEELEDKVKELEFCLEEAKKENRNSIEVIKRTNLVKNLLINLTALKDSEGRILVEDKCILTHRKVEGNKVYEIARLLG